MAEYRPSPYVKEILDWCLRVIASVAYDVTARWLFYRLIQERGLGGKVAYKNQFLKWISRARKGFYGGWAPWTVTDDGREITVRGDGPITERDWITGMRNTPARLRLWGRQPNIVLVLFEAAAMYSQFQHYLGDLRVSMAPFKGDASIPHKWNIAKWIEKVHQIYPDKPIVVLYFGDLDPKGLEIPVSALKDIWSWAQLEGVDSTLYGVGDEWVTSDGMFRWIRCGINPDQVLNIPENPDRPGTYQWEALDDQQAEAVIMDNIHQWWDVQVVRELEDEETDITGRWTRFVDTYEFVEDP